MAESPYIRIPERLADVIAAIQVMATYKFYKLSFDEWSGRITGDKSNHDHWEQVFRDHPEFFRLDRDQNMASLVWRRTFPKRFNVDTEEIISIDEYEKLSEKEKKRISRQPLGSREVEILVNAAINVHSREVDRKRDARWWVAGVFGVAGVVIGGLFQWLTS